MAVECSHCKRESRDGDACEWCGKPLEVEGDGAATPARAATVQDLEAGSTTDPPVAAAGEAIAGADGALVVAQPWTERLADYGIDAETVPILALILFSTVVSLARGGLTLYSLPIVLWLGVGAGVAVRGAWSLALALVLVCLEIAFALFGIGPSARLGLASWAPIDFTMTFLRIVAGTLILRLRDELG